MMTSLRPPNLLRKSGSRRDCQCHELIYLPDSRAARAGASKAIEIAKPAMKNGVEQTSQAVEKVQHDGLQYWQQSGRAQVGLCIKDTQEVSCK